MKRKWMLAMLVIVLTGLFVGGSAGSALADDGGCGTGGIHEGTGVPSN